jgi:hypothetical protein
MALVRHHIEQEIERELPQRFLGELRRCAGRYKTHPQPERPPVGRALLPATGFWQALRPP